MEPNREEHFRKIREQDGGKTHEEDKEYTRVKDLAQIHDKFPLTRQAIDEEQTSNEEPTGEEHFCGSCVFRYEEYQNESHVEEANTGKPFTPPHEEKDEVLVLQGMFERIIHNY